jgi:hypothetical protein
LAHQGSAGQGITRDKGMAVALEAMLADYLMIGSAEIMADLISI